MKFHIQSLPNASFIVTPNEPKPARRPYWGQKTPKILVCSRIRAVEFCYNRKSTVFVEIALFSLGRKYFFSLARNILFQLPEFFPLESKKRKIT